MTPRSTDITRLTYANAAVIATIHAADDYGEQEFYRLPIAEQNKRVEPYLRHMWRLLESSQANRRRHQRRL